MKHRNEQLELAEALSSPKSIFQIIMALNAPEHLSPYKKQLIDLILEEVSLDVFFHELFIMREMGKIQEDVRRDVILTALKDKEAAAHIFSRQAFQYAASAPRKILERNETLIELECRAKYLEDILKDERPLVEEALEKIEKNSHAIKEVDTNWATRHQALAKEYCDELAFKKELFPVQWNEHIEDRLKKVMTPPAPSKLVAINRDIVKEAGEDQKKIEVYANTMAQKGAFICRLGVLDILGGTKVRLGQDDGQEHNLSPKELLKLDKQIPVIPGVKENKSEIAKVITAVNQNDILQKKVDKVLAMEKALNKINDTIMDLKNHPAPTQKGPGAHI